MRIGIDATNIGGGGGITHLVEIISHFNNAYFSTKITKIVVFGSETTLRHVPDTLIVEKINSPYLNSNILLRFFFQFFYFDKLLRDKCDILLSLTGDYFGKFEPLVSMSRNMLLYEKDNWKLISDYKEKFKFWSSLQKQKICFRKSLGIIFISNFAKEIITRKLNLVNKKFTVIPHGVSNKFFFLKEQKPISSYNFSTPFRFVYVSTIHVYKHQWNVVKAISKLRILGYPVELHLVGGIIYKPAGKMLYEAIKKYDPNNEFVFNHGHVPYNKIEEVYENSNGIIFASTCENMPNILIESMASGMPIACSDKYPMPEFLGESKFYFNSKRVDSIVEALESLLNNLNLRTLEAQNNLAKSKLYNWSITSKKTFDYILKIKKDSKNV